MSQPTSLPIACDMNATSPDQRNRYDAVRAQMAALSEGVDDRADGYTLRFPAASEVIVLLAEFITFERLCCPFLHFQLDVAPEGQAVRLSLYGGEGVKAFLAEELGLP